MCSPEALIGAQVAQGIFGAQSAEEMAEAQAAVANQNAQNYERMAVDATRRGSDNQYAAIRRGRQLIGQQLVAMAANNVDSSSGSMANLIADTAANSVYEGLIALNNAQREAYGYRVSAANERTNANIYRAQGRTSALGSLLTGGINVGNTWLRYYGNN